MLIKYAEKLIKILIIFYFLQTSFDFKEVRSPI